MRSTTLRRWWLATVAVTAVLLGLTNPATGQPGRATGSSFIASKARELEAAGPAARTRTGHHGGVTVVADRLNNPRGLDLRHGALYVAEAGTGGPCLDPVEGPCVGLTSSITKVSHGRQRRVVEGLLSIAGPDGTGAVGVDDVSVARRGGGLFMIATTLGCQDQVPTSVTRGPDGAYYVGTLAEGAGNGGAKVWRIVPGHAPEVYADGLTAVVDIAFGPDGSLYASEFLVDLTSETDPSGAVVRIRPSGRRTVLGQGALFLPGGIAVDRHGHLYVANWSILPATGSADPVFLRTPAGRWCGCPRTDLGALQARDPGAEEVVADLLGAAPGVAVDLVAGEAEDGVALGDQVTVAAAFPDDLVGAGRHRAGAVDLDHHPGQDEEVDPVGPDLAVGLDPGPLGGVGEPGGQPLASQGTLDPAEQAAGGRVGPGQELDHGGAEGGPDRLRPSWPLVAASGDWMVHWLSPASPYAREAGKVKLQLNYNPVTTPMSSSGQPFRPQMARKP